MTSVAVGAIIMGASSAFAQERASIELAPQSLASALYEFGRQTGHQVIFSPELTKAKTTPGVSGGADEQAAMAQLLTGTGLTFRREGNTFLIVEASGPQGGSAAGDGAEVDALIVTAQKREEDIQDVPIAISAFTQESLEKAQIAGGPDLITQIPNMSFTKTNFSSYSIQIRGIGTQAISATTDPAVAVAFNNTPFIRNRFFEQEFYDLQRLEVLRGPQGTLYGRNATAGVVNIISAKPKFTYEAKLSADIANYNSTRLEGMINFPLVNDVVALRVAGAWTKRDGYVTNQLTGAQIDGRDLWSMRVSLRFAPTDNITADLIWEHFEEDDDRLRSGKQLCKRDDRTEIGGLPFSAHPGGGGAAFGVATYATQGCVRSSLYEAGSFQTPNGFSLPYYGPTGNLGNPVKLNIDPYLNAVQSHDLRVIESTLEPEYMAKADIFELQVTVDLSDTLTLTSETAYGADSLFSVQDYNRFTTTPGVFNTTESPIGGTPVTDGTLSPDGVFCDPQLGCSDRLLAADLSTEESTQFSQEFRLGSDFDGPFNFSLGANFLRHDAEAKYYVFFNTLSLFSLFGEPGYVPGVTDNSHCLPRGDGGGTARYHDPEATYSVVGCTYVDPNPIGALNDEGRNYFLSRNPYSLISYAAFGEAYYNLTPTLKLTGGLRWTVDKKKAPQIRSWLLAADTAGAYPVSKVVDQEWNEPTGRLALDWQPDLDFTDETLIYASYAHGYKAGGANPPPPVFATYAGAGASEVLPDTFGPEFVDAFEVGTKNTMLDGALTLNLSAFYYDYEGYQVSEIRNRSAVNSNYDAEVWGFEMEADWRPNEALRLGFKGGYNGTRIADGQSAIDLMDRTAGNEDWVVVRPFPTVPSNCIIPIYVATAGGRFNIVQGYYNVSANGACTDAYRLGKDPVTGFPYDPSITDYGALLGPAFADYQGWDPSTAPNGGNGFSKDLGGNELPNAPNYTATVTADYTVPLANDWLMNLHGDVHWQSESWWRVFQDHEYSRLEDFYVVNLAAIFTNEEAGWRVMTYVKNVLDEDALTGAFLNSDDSGLTTNVFLTEPRLYGVRVTKDFTGGGWLGGFGERRSGPYPLAIELGGGASRFSAEADVYAPEWLDTYSADFPIPNMFDDEELDWGDTRSVKLTYMPGDWRISAAYRFGKANSEMIRTSGYEHVPGSTQQFTAPDFTKYDAYVPSDPNHLRAAAEAIEKHEIVDFMVGRNVGFGSLGGRATLSAGVRRAELQSTASIKIDGVPNRVQREDFSPVFPPIDRYLSELSSERSFEGAGPFVEWDGAVPVLGGEETGLVNVDWTVGAGVLFGSQRSESEEGQYNQHYALGILGYAGSVTLDEQIPRSREEDVTVPNLSLSLGLSYAIDRIKVSTGYSYDRFFNAIDGGWQDEKSYGRTIHGPFVKFSFGFGG